MTTRDLCYAVMVTRLEIQLSPDYRPLAAHPVSTRVNNPANTDRALCAPIRLAS